MAYVAQLLPDLKQARILCTALLAYTERGDISEEERDLAWALLSKLTNDMRKNNDRSSNSQ